MFQRTFFEGLYSEGKFRREISVSKSAGHYNWSDIWVGNFSMCKINRKLIEIRDNLISLNISTSNTTGINFIENINVIVQNELRKRQ